MSKDKRLAWLKRVLAFKVILCFLFWGLPNLLYPTALLERMGVPIPDDPLFLRLAGALIIALGVAYWYAWKEPLRNVAIVKVGVVDNGLVSLVNLYFILFGDLRSVVMLVSAGLTFFFFISFILLMPKTETV